MLARPGKDLLAELEQAGLPGLPAQTIATAAAQRLSDHPAASRLLLVIDQFEELLTPAGSDEQDEVQREAAMQLSAAIGAPE